MALNYKLLSLSVCLSLNSILWSLSSLPITVSVVPAIYTLCVCVPSASVYLLCRSLIPSCNRLTLFHSLVPLILSVSVFFYTCLLLLLVADSLFRLTLSYTCRGEHSHFWTPGYPQKGWKIISFHGTLKGVIKFLKLLILFNLISVFITCRAESMIPAQIYLGPYMDINTYVHTYLWSTCNHTHAYTRTHTHALIWS